MSEPKQLFVNQFEMACVSHITHGLWPLPGNNRERFADLDYWLELAQLLEHGGFDGIFLADVIGAYDVFRGGPETALREGGWEIGTSTSARSGMFSISTSAEIRAGRATAARLATQPPMDDPTSTTGPSANSSITASRSSRQRPMVACAQAPEDSPCAKWS